MSGVPAVGDHMHPGQMLAPDASIVSANGRYGFVYQAGDGNLVLYRTGDGTPLWDIGARPGGAGECIMQTDGNLVVYTAGGLPVWSSATDGNPGAALVVQDDGNLVIYLPDGTPIWETATQEPPLPAGVPAVGDHMHPGQMLAPDASIVSANGRYGFVYQAGDGNLVLYRTGDGTPLWDIGARPGGAGECIMQTDGNLVVYTAGGLPVWSSATDGNPGAALVVQDDGNLVIYLPDGTPIWETATQEPPLPAGVPAVGDHMHPGQMLAPDASIVSANGRYGFVYQAGDGNLVLYRTGDGTPLWDIGARPGGAGECIMQTDGNLVVYTAGGLPVWSSATDGNPGAALVVQDDGNLVIYLPDGTPIWETATQEPPLPAGVPAVGDHMHPGQMLAPDASIVSANGRYGFVYQAGDGNLVLYRTGDGTPLWDIGARPGGAGECIMQTDGNLVVYTAGGLPVWSSATDGNPGAALVVQDDGNLVIYLPDGTPIWETATLEGFWHRELKEVRGWVELRLASNGTSIFSGHAHNDALLAEAVQYTVRIAAGGDQVVVFQHSGNLGGFGANPDQRNDYWTETTIEPGVAMQYDDLVSGSIEVYEYRKGAILGELTRIVEFISTTLLGAFILDPTVGLVIFAGAELASLIKAGNVVPAAQILKGTLYMLGPAATSYAVIADGVAVIGQNRRPITATEYNWANSWVFSGTLPPIQQIEITDTIGAADRAFTFPSPNGMTVNLGADYANPMTSNPTLFIHELAHAWQIHNYPNRTEYIAKGFAAQLFNVPYEYGPAGPPFRDFNIEQQAAIVDDWFTKAADDLDATKDPYFMYIRDNIRKGLP